MIIGHTYAEFHWQWFWCIHRKCHDRFRLIKLSVCVAAHTQLVGAFIFQAEMFSGCCFCHKSSFRKTHNAIWLLVFHCLPNILLNSLFVFLYSNASDRIMRIWIWKWIVLYVRDAHSLISCLLACTRSWLNENVLNWRFEPHLWWQSSEMNFRKIPCNNHDETLSNCVNTFIIQFYFHVANIAYRFDFVLTLLHFFCCYRLWRLQLQSSIYILHIVFCFPGRLIANTTVIIMHANERIPNGIR